MKYPNMRAELVEYLQFLSEDPVSREKTEMDDCYFDYAIHFLFDDTLIARDSQECVGIFLINKYEANTIFAVAEKLDEIFNKYGTRLHLYDYYGFPEWVEVIEKCKSALSLLAMDGDGLD